MKMKETIIREVEKFVTGLLKNETPETYAYHTLDHTMEVVKNAVFIGTKENLPKDEMSILRVAAWFHDVGYLSKLNNHEEASALEARSFLSKNVADEAFIRQVENCILATKIPQDPHDTLSAILCDADLFHVSQPDFLENVHFFWDEIKALNGIKQPDSFYLENTLRFFEAHHFKTNYGQTILDPGKKENMERVRRTLQKLKK